MIKQRTDFNVQTLTLAHTSGNQYWLNLVARSCAIFYNSAHYYIIDELMSISSIKKNVKDTVEVKEKEKKT